MELWHGERFFCNLKVTQTRSTQSHSVGMQFYNTPSNFLSQCVLNKIMETIKVVGVPDSPRLPFSACVNMQAIKLLFLEEIPEGQLLSDNCSSECSSLQDV